MASILRIKRSSVSGNPGTLAAGELAYSALLDTGSNGGDRLYLGMGIETGGNAANHLVIGGTAFTNLLDHTPGTLTASSALITDSNSKLDNIKVDNIDLNGNTISTLDTNGNLVLNPNGAGMVQIAGTWTLPRSAGTNGYALITDGTSSASWVEISTNLTVAGDTGSDVVSLVTDTLTFAGGTGITSTVTNSNVDFSIDNTVATLTGSQTLTNKTIDLANNTLTATSAQLATAISDETGTGVLVFSNTPTLVTPVLGVATATSINKLTITAPTTSATLSLADGSTLGTVGAFTTTLTATGITALTLPTTGTLATLAGSESLTNKTIGSGSTYQGNTVAVGYGGTGTTNGSITGTGALTYTAGGTNANINLVPVGTGTVDVASKRITGVATPTSGTDAANKNYVDNAVTGLDWKAAVNLLAESNIALTGLTNTLVIDGHAALDSADNDVYRILLKGQTTASENGIYTYFDDGTNYTLTRSLDADVYTELLGTSVFIEEGTIYGSTGWLQSNHYLTSFAGQTWVQFSGAGTYSAGNGLTLTGNEFDVVGTTDRISVATNSVDIASTYVGQSSITTLGTIGTGTWQAGIISPTYGGTGINNGVKTITLGGNFTHTGAHTLGLTTTGATSVTLPTTGTLATLAGTESLSNKTITASSFSGTTVAASGLSTFTNTTDASSLTTAAVILSGGLAVTKQIFVGTHLTGAGAATSTLSGFDIDGGTY